MIITEGEKFAFGLLNNAAWFNLSEQSILIHKHVTVYNHWKLDTQIDEQNRSKSGVCLIQYKSIAESPY